MKGKIENRITARILPPRAPIEPGSVWTPAFVDMRLDRAAATLAELPTGLRRSITMKVDVVHRASEAYGYNEASTRVMPSSQDITDAEATLAWLHWLTDRERVLVWGRACGIGWGKLAKRLGYTERSLSDHRKRAVLKIVVRLNGVRPLAI